MIILGIILSVFAIGFFCWLLFTLAVYALPFYIGLTAAFTAYHNGYGVLGSGLIAIVVGAGVLALGQLLFAAVRVPILRALYRARLRDSGPPSRAIMRRSALRRYAFRRGL